MLTEETAYLMVNLLQGVVLSGSGQRMRREPYSLMNQIGGKTGTAQEQSDGWFIGITPSLVGGVWSGWEDRAIHFGTLGEGQGPIWLFRYLRHSLEKFMMILRQDTSDRGI